MIGLLHVDDYIVFSKKSGISDSLIESLPNGNECFEFTYKGNFKSYFGMDIHIHKNESIEITQTYLTERCIVLVDQEQNLNVKATSTTKPLLHKDTDGLERKRTWNYREAIGMLTYLQGTSRPDIFMTSHQAAKFYNNLKLSHEKYSHRIGRFLRVTKIKESSLILTEADVGTKPARKILKYYYLELDVYSCILIVQHYFVVNYKLR